MKETTFAFIIAGIFAAELVLNIFFEFGLLIYVIFIGAVLILMENRFDKGKDEKLLIFLIIVPMCRIPELFLDFNFFWKTLIFYVPVIAITIYYARSLKLSSRPFIGNILIAVGVFFFSGVLALLAYSFDLKFAGLVFLIPIIAYAEEMLFRGGIQNLTRESYGVMSIIFTSILYATFSMNYGFIFLLIALGASLVISTIYHFTKNLYLSYGLNIVFHTLLFIFYPFVI